MKLSLLDFINKYILALLPSVMVVVLFWVVIKNYLPQTKGAGNLLKMVAIISFDIFLGILLYYLFSFDFRSYINSIVRKLLGKGEGGSPIADNLI